MRKVKKITKKVKVPNLLDNLPKNEEEFLELRIKSAERSIGPHDTSIDQYFKQLADRLKKELAELRNK